VFSVPIILVVLGLPVRRQSRTTTRARTMVERRGLLVVVVVLVVLGLPVG
jgi:hypothetical protein